MSSLVGKVETDVELNASAQNVYDMFCNKPVQISNSTSLQVQAYDLSDGDWGKEGSIVCWNYVYDGEPRVLKERIELIDRNKKSITVKVIEGDLLKEYKSLVITIQVTPKSEGEGSIMHWTMEYEKLHEETNPEALLLYAIQISKDTAAHLIQGN